MALLTLTLLAAMWLDTARLDLHAAQPSYLLLDRRGRFIAEIGSDPNGLGYWPVPELPPRVVAALLELEDRRFYEHPGVDLRAVARALYQNLTHGERVSGASTIAMQVARLLQPAERHYGSKLRETWRALFLTARYGREEILRAYLRLVPYGNRVHGIGYAARRYLDKPVADLSWAEIAFLSAIPQAPTTMNPFRENGRPRAIARGQFLLQRLYDRQLLSAAEFELAQQQLQDIRLPVLAARPAHSLHAMFRLNELLNGAAPATGSEPYRITTTLDLDLQQTVAGFAAETVSQWDHQGASNAAVLIVDRASMNVLAWLGSADYFADTAAGAIDFVRTPRSPGSSLKPFFYALAYERGDLTPATILDDLPSTSSGISNSDHQYLGPLLPRQALATSRNIPAVQVLNTVGLDEGFAFLRELGLHQNEHEARYYGRGLAIGALPVSLEQLVQAYSVLANDGQWRALRWYAGQREQTRTLLSPAVSRILTLQLSDAGARLPTFPRMGPTEFAYPVALKTGTSQGQRDAWTVAYSRRYLLGVWLGNAQARPMHDISGGRQAAELAQRILNHLHGAERHGAADGKFPPPPDYRPVALCALTGKRATPACEQTFEEWFAPGREPLQDDDAHLRLAVDVRNGLLAHAQTPKDFVERRTFIALPARYAEWAAKAGLPRPPQAVSGAGAGTGTGTRAVLSLRAHSTPVQSLSSARYRLRILSPRDGVELLSDPTLPAAFATLTLRAEVSPAVPEVLWLVDGKPFQLAAYPYTVHWPLQSGSHRLQLAIPLRNLLSDVVHFRVE